MEHETAPVLIGFDELYRRYGAGRTPKGFRQNIWRWTKEGRFPAPVEVGPWVRAWRVADLERWERGLRTVGSSTAP